MRLDHLLSMETMTAFHGVVGVEKIDEKRFKRSWYGTFVVQFSEIREDL